MYPVGFVSLENPDTQALLISEDVQKICSEIKSFLNPGIIRAIDTFQGSGNSTEGGQTLLAQERLKTHSENDEE